MLYAIVGLLLLLIDQFMKYWTVAHIELNADPGKVLIPGLLNWTHIKNFGAAFGLGSKFGGLRWILLILLLAVTAFIVLGLVRRYLRTGLARWSGTLLLAGLLGNGVDRAIYGYVVDMLEPRLGSLRLPIFNLADCLVVVFGILFCISLFTGGIGAPAEDDEEEAPRRARRRRYDDEDDEDEDERPRRRVRRYEDEEEEEPPRRVRRESPESAAAQRARAQSARRPSAQEAQQAVRAANRSSAQPRSAQPQSRTAQARPTHSGAQSRPVQPRSAQSGAQSSETRPVRPIVPEETAPARRETVRPAAAPESEATVRTVERPAARPQTAAAPAPATAVTEATAAPKASAETAADEFDLDSILAEFK